MEGPMCFGKQTDSYLVNYRYSTLSLLSKIGVNIGDASTDFQDLSFNLWMPAGKLGQFTLFGIGGISTQAYQGEADSLLWEDDGDKQYQWDFKANTGVLGLTHSLVFGDNTFLKSVVAVSGTLNGDNTEEFQEDYALRPLYNENHRQSKVTVSSVLTHKFSARHLLRTGAYVNFLDFRLQQYEWDDDAERITWCCRTTNRCPATGISNRKFITRRCLNRNTRALMVSGGTRGLMPILSTAWSAAKNGTGTAAAKTAASAST